MEKRDLTDVKIEPGYEDYERVPLGEGYYLYCDITESEERTSVKKAIRNLIPEEGRFLHIDIEIPDTGKLEILHMTVALKKGGPRYRFTFDEGTVPYFSDGNHLHFPPVETTELFDKGYTLQQGETGEVVITLYKNGLTVGEYQIYVNGPLSLNSKAGDKPEDKSYSLVALTENGRVRMVPSLENEMKKAYEEKIARLDSQEYDDEQEWLLARSAAWEEYAEFFLGLGNLRQAYRCYEKAATVTSPCSEQLWVQNMNCERPVMPLYYRFLAMHDKCRHLVGQRPELLDEYNGSELQRNYLFYTEDERADSREMRESYQSMKAWDFGKD